jgi:hypothetical protein
VRIVTTIIIIAVVVAAVLALAGAGALFMRQRQERRAFQEQFGPEYDRAVDRYGGSERKAAGALKDREKRVEKLDIQPLSSGAKTRLAEQWKDVQLQFVDDPGGALAAADDLIVGAMRQMSYPVEDFAQREEAVSVKYPEVADEYRAGHQITVRAQAGDVVDTEELRTAMVHHRNLFERFVGAPQMEQAGIGQNI